MAVAYSTVTVDVLAAVDKLETFPMYGRMVPEVNDAAIREVILMSYRIVYKLDGEVVEILTVYHGARLLDPNQF